VHLKGEEGTRKIKEKKKTDRTKATLTHIIKWKYSEPSGVVTLMMSQLPFHA
jgi:hypothetical protein